jgi:hypothetical protein
MYRTGGNAILFGKVRKGLSMPRLVLPIAPHSPRDRRAKRIAVLPTALLAALLMSPAAHAHGGGDSLPEGNICTQTLSGHPVEMGAYQPAGGFGRYCPDLRAGGETVVTFDLLDEALKTVPISVKIVEATEADDGPVIAEKAAAVYPVGIIEVEALLKDSGEYTAILTAIDAGQAVSARFPFHTGSGVSTVLYVVLAIAAIAFGAGFYYFTGRKRLI